jgi:hypothetical protein
MEGKNENTPIILTNCFIIINSATSKMQRLTHSKIIFKNTQSGNQIQWRRYYLFFAFAL